MRSGVNIIESLSREEDLDEPSLIQRAAQGEPAAWEPLMLAYQEPVFRFAYLLLGDPDDAEDVTQETFLRAYYHLGRFDTARPLRPWLLSIAANLSRNRRRSASRYLNAISRAFRLETQTSPNVEERSELDQASHQLWKAVRRLSTDDQQMVYLRFFLDLSVAETAQALDVAEGTIKSRLNRALGRLRAIVKNDFPMLSEGYEV
jgi:RNA polymerase sigma-70 factor (ECF subfamily)